MKKAVVILVLASFIPTQLSAWGPKGHAIIADLAISRLTPVTRANIQLLLGTDTLASVASWADQVRKERDESYNWHFVDIPKDAPGFSEARDCFRPQDKHKNADTDHHNCVVDRIEIFEKVLQDENASRTDRQEALKWIVHFVGDLHQPLHAIEEGHGGNDIKVPVFGSAKCGDFDCNLHWTWDDLLLQHAGYSEDEYVAQLNKLINEDHFQQKAGGKPADWANESHQQARGLVDPRPSSVDEQYYQAHIGMVNERLALAGLRLAAVLNATLGNIPTKKLQQDLEKHSQENNHAAGPPQQESDAVRAEKLPTGMSITPGAAHGTSLQLLNPDLPGMPEYLADHPIATALSPDGKTLLVLTSGFNRILDIKGKGVPELSNEYVFVYDVRQNPPVKRQALPVPNTYMGMAWAPGGDRFFVAGGMDDNIHVFSENEGRWSESLPAIPLGHAYGLGVSEEEGDKENRPKPVAAGVAVSADGTRLLVANSANDSVSLIDLAQKKIIGELDLRPGKIDPKQKGVPGGEYPYDVVFKGNDKAFVSCQRDREIVALDLRTTLVVTARTKTHGQPGKMVLNAAQTALLAVSDNSDSVVIIDTSKDRILSEIKTAAPTGMLPRKPNFKGANPTGLALSPDERTLYVTNGGTNSVAVVQLDRELDEGHVIGLVPTGWYPNAVSVSRDGRFLYVVNAKSNAGPNPSGCRNSFVRSGDRRCYLTQQYVWQLEKGTLASIPRPQPEELKSLTILVGNNNHFSVASQPTENKELFSFLRTRIHHVIYIVKENRSYDQVLGDLEKGNGDPRLNLFPDALTPNHHEMARRFVALDNFYDSGEVSGNGWNWSTAARATDFVERTIPMNYARRGLGYDVEGINRGINVGAAGTNRIHGKVDDPENELPGNGDVAAPDGPDDETGAGYLWDSALRAKLTVRNYGFFSNLAHYSSTATGGPAVPLLHDPAATGVRVAFPANPRLQEITDPYFRSFDMRFADYWRFKEWEREFDEYVKHDNLPNLELLRLPHDHFGNFSDAQDGVNTVETMMADNDYALGLVLEKVAHSKYAGDTLVFVIEDDAQNGADHVDAHRSIAYVAGPYVKHKAVVSQYYTTVSMLRTIEDVLGIAPLGLNDAFQPPMAEVFSQQQAEWTYTAHVPAILRTTQLPVPPAGPQEKTRSLPPQSGRRDAVYWAAKTRGMDFSVEDKIDTAAFNKALWEGLKGNTPMPEEQDGRDLRQHRRKLLQKNATVQPAALTQQK